MPEAARTLDAIADGGTRSRWMTTLVDLAALLLSMFVLLLATRPSDTTRAYAYDGVLPPADTAPVLEQDGPEDSAQTGLVLAWLRERLRGAALDDRVLVRVAREGVLVELGAAMATSLAESAGSDPGGDIRSLAAVLSGLGPELRGVVLTYAGRGTACVVDDLHAATASAIRLGQAGLRTPVEPVLEPAPAPGRPPVELRLVLESA